MSGSGKDLGQGYVNFARNNMDQIRGKINDELWILNFFEQWYTQQINMLCNWLSERLGHSLHFYQCTCLAHIVKVSAMTISNSFMRCKTADALILRFACRKSIPTLNCKV